MSIDRTVIDALTDEEFAGLEQRVEKLLSVWEICNLRGQAATFHDDQHIGEPRRELKALKHPSFDVEGEMAFPVLTPSSWTITMSTRTTRARMSSHPWNWNVS